MWGSTRAQEEEGGEVCKSLYCGFRGRDGQTGLGLASLNNRSRLWDIMAVWTCLAPGPGVIRTGGEWPRVGA